MARKKNDDITPLPAATMHDVAKKAGVAISSVSRALSGHPDVSPKMRKKVEEATRLLGYEPDLLAQSMRSGETRTIGCIITDIANPLFAQVAKSCEQELRKSGYSMILMSSDHDERTETENFSVLRRRRVDGVIASLVSEKSPLIKSELKNLRSPVVLLDREVKGFNCSSVTADHYGGLRTATNHLLSQGHRRIAFITGSADVLITRERVRGYKDAFTENKIKCDESLIRLGEFNDEFSERQTFSLFSRPNYPTALLCGGVSATAGALRVLKSLDIEIGKDVALVAIDEWPMFDVIAPTISSVYRDPELIGREAARIVLEVLRTGKVRKAVLDTRFVVRASTSTKRRIPKTSSR